MRRYAAPHRTGLQPHVLSLLTSAALAYLQAVRSWGDLDSTCGSPGHSHRRTAVGPTKTQHRVQSTD